VPTLHTNHIQIAKFQNAVSGDDIYILDIWGTFFITNLVFWSIGSIYCYFDVTTTPKFLRKYKIQPETNEPVDPKKFKNLIWTVFLNQTVVYIPLRFTRSYWDYVNKNSVYILKSVKKHVVTQIEDTFIPLGFKQELQFKS
jgi:hypothetical protein